MVILGKYSLKASAEISIVGCVFRQRREAVRISTLRTIITALAFVPH